jgi:hypothetical protein
MIYDLAIVGCGLAGALAAYKLATDYPTVKVIIFDSGRPPLKRRTQVQGFLGNLPSSDGKLYLNNLSQVSSVIGTKKTNQYFEQFKKILHNIEFFPTVKDKGPQKSIVNKLKNNNYNLILNNYIQLYPKNMHELSRFFVKAYDQDKNLIFKFDTDANFISKDKDLFTINTDYGDYQAKKLIVAVGRSGWRWAGETFKKFGIITFNNVSKIGIRVEINSELMNEYNHSPCMLTKDNIEIGPFCWNGTVIPEDHFDLVISNFRSNEERWKTDKVSFNIIGSQIFDNNGFEQTDRMGKLTFIVVNDRVIKEKIITLLSNKSKISVFPEYNFLKDSILDLSNIIPDVVNRASFYVPTLTPIAPQINIGDNLSTEVKNMYVVGESALLPGLLSAAITGLSVVDSIFK